MGTEPTRPGQQSNSLTASLNCNHQGQSHRRSPASPDPRANPPSPPNSNPRDTSPHRERHTPTHITTYTRHILQHTTTSPPSSPLPPPPHIPSRGWDAVAIRSPLPCSPDEVQPSAPPHTPAPVPPCCIATLATGNARHPACLPAITYPPAYLPACTAQRWGIAMLAPLQPSNATPARTRPPLWGPPPRGLP